VVRGFPLWTDHSSKTFNSRNLPSRFALLGHPLFLCKANKNRRQGNFAKHQLFPLLVEPLRVFSKPISLHRLLRMCILVDTIKVPTYPLLLLKFLLMTRSVLFWSFSFHMDQTNASWASPTSFHRRWGTPSFPPLERDLFEVRSNLYGRVPSSDSFPDHSF